MRSITKLPREVLVLLGVLAATAVTAFAAPTTVPPAVLLTGFVGGATLALYALGVVLVHRADRFLNIAAVQTGALAATLFAILARGNTLLRWGANACPPCLERIGPGARAVNVFVSLILSLLLAAGASWLLHRVIAHRLRGMPPVVPTVATVFAVQLLAGLGGALPRFLLTQGQRDRDIVRGTVAFPGDRTWTVGVAVFHVVDLLLVGLVITAVGGLLWFLRQTETGRELRAASDNPDRAATLAIDVDRAGGRVWALAGLLSGVAATLTVTRVGTEAVASGLSLPTLVRILVVAAAARFVSIPIAALAAGIIGVLDATVAFGFGTQLPVDGALVLIVAALLLAGGRDLMTRSEAEGVSRWRANQELRPTPAAMRALPTVRSARRTGIALLVFIGAGLPWALSPSQTSTVTVAAAYAIVGLSVLVLTGWAGSMSLGQFAFAAVGAWVAASLRLPLPVGLVVGAAAGAGIAAVVGIPALRLRGLQLPVATVAFALAVSAVLLNPRYLGRALPDDLRRPRLLGLDLADARVAWYFGLVLVALAAIAVGGLRRSRTARVLIGARDNERFAQSLGVDVLRARLVAFAVSGALAGMAGVWVSVLTSGVSGDTFAPERSVTLFVYAVIGGLGSLAGPLLGFAAFAVVGLLSSDPTLVSLAGGAGGLALLLGLPGGLAALLADGRDAFVRRAARRARLATAGLSARDEPVDIAPVSAAAVASGRYALERQWGAPGGR